MFRLLSELLNQPQLRKWLLFKLSHPFDRPIDIHNPPLQFKDIKLNQTAELHDLSMRSLQLELQDNIPDESNIFIRLASQKVPLNQFWQLQNDNRNLSGEDREALYRFNGLLLLACEKKCSITILEKAFDRWFHDFSSNTIAMQAYVTSERLANIAILICRSKVFENWTEKRIALFKQATRRDTESLLKNLEYLGERLTGNHLSNNARGLAWGAYLLGDSNLLELAINFAWQESMRIFDADGFLREGSSNYHNLLTRNYLELLILARRFSLPIQKQLSILCQTLCKNSLLLRPQQQEPFIGDISPDFPHEYFSDVPYFLNTATEQNSNQKMATGWASHFVESIYTTDTTHSFASKSFARMDHEQISILCHYNPDGYPILASHAHCDSGSFVSFYKNKEVVIDAGRHSYADRDDKMISSGFHNFIQIDHCSLESHIRGVYGPTYLKKLFYPPHVHLLEQNKLQFDFYWNQFQIKHKRVIQIKNKQIHIQDNLSGQGNRLIELHLNFADKNTAKKCQSSLGPISLQKKQRSRNYGQIETMTVAYVQKKIQLPCFIETIIDLSEV